MYRYFLTLSIVLVLSPGCEKKVTHSYKLTDEQLAQLMLDIHLSDVIIPELSEKHQDSVKMILWKRLEDIYQLPESELKMEIDKLEDEPEKLKLIVNRARELADSIQ